MAERGLIEREHAQALGGDVFAFLPLRQRNRGIERMDTGRGVGVACGQQVVVLLVVRVGRPAPAGRCAGRKSLVCRARLGVGASASRGREAPDLSAFRVFATSRKERLGLHLSL